MEKINRLFVPEHVIVIFALTATFFTGAFLFSYNPFLPLFAGGSLLVLSLFFSSPLLLLAILIVVRMSLDYSSQYVTLNIFETTLTLSQLIGLGIAALGSILIFQNKEKLLKYPFFYPLLLVFFWGASTLPYSIVPGSTLTELIRIFGLLSIGFMAYLVTKKTQDYKILLIALLVSSFLPVLFSLYQFLFGVGFSDSDVALARIFGTFSHPNILSLYLFSLLVVTVLFFLIPSLKESAQKKNISLVLFGIFSLLLLLTFTRVAWVVAFLFVATLLFFRFRIALIPIVILPIILYFISPNFSDRVQESLSPDPDSSIVWRQNLWHDTTLKTVQDDRQILGYGMSSFPFVSENLRGENKGSNDPHNDLIRFFVEGGYIGLLVYLVYSATILFILLRAAFTQKGWLKDSLLIMSLFWLCLLFASLSDNIFKNTPVEWIFFILAGSLVALAQKNIPKKGK